MNSSANCNSSAENALREFTKLEKVTIPERLPKANSLADVSEYSNFALRSLARDSDLNEIIFGVPMDSLFFTDKERLADTFDSPNEHNYDSVHPKGRLGRKLYNYCLITTVRMAGLTTKGHMVEN